MLLNAQPDALNITLLMAVSPVERPALQWQAYYILWLKHK
jgi:hypothetical protein